MTDIKKNLIVGFDDLLDGVQPRHVLSLLSELGLFDVTVSDLVKLKRKLAILRKSIDSNKSKLDHALLTREKLAQLTAKLRDADQLFEEIRVLHAKRTSPSRKSEYSNWLKLIASDDRNEPPEKRPTRRPSR